MPKTGNGAGAVIDSDLELAMGLEPLFEKLKPGPGLPAEEVLANQRRRLHGAMIALMDGAGWSGVRVRSLAGVAGVSTSTFYKHFVNADECLASAYEEFISTAVHRSTAAQRNQSEWPDALRAAVTTLLREFSMEPRKARLALLEIFAAGPSARKRISHAIGELEGLLAASFSGAPRTISPPRHLIAGMTAGMLRIARTTTLAGRGVELPGLADQLVDWMLTLPSSRVLSLLTSRPGTAPEVLLSPSATADDSNRPPVVVDDHGRLMRAILKLAAVEGFSELTAPRLRAEAGVSRRKFDACFGSLDECFIAAIETVAGDAVSRARLWAESDSGWERCTCRLVWALCAEAARNRRHARLAFLGILAPGRTGLLGRERLIGQTAAELRATIPAEHRPAPIEAEASVAAAWHIAQSDIASGRARSLPSIAPLLSYVVLAPIVGAESAAGAIQEEMSTLRRLKPAPC